MNFTTAEDLANNYISKYLTPERKLADIGDD